MWNAILINMKWKLFSKIENEIESAPSRHMIFISCWSPMKDSTIYWMHCGRFPQEKHMWYMYVRVCVFVVHICNASYTEIEFLTRSLDGGRPTQRRQAWNFAYFSHVNDTEVPILYLRSPDICMLENILTSPPASRTDSTKLTYSFLRLTSWHLKAKRM